MTTATVLWLALVLAAFLVGIAVGVFAFAVYLDRGDPE